MNRAHVAAALRHLADAIDSAVSTSDQGLSKTRPGEPFGAAQKKNTAKIRHLSRNATSGSRRNLAGIEKSARTETGRAFRSQVRKIRLSRAHTKDEPGGEA